MMRACARWVANDYLAARGLPLEPICDHNPTDCPPHRLTPTPAGHLPGRHHGGHMSTDYIPPSQPHPSPPPPPPTPPTAVPDARETGLTPEQEIRARALDIAASWLAYLDEDAGQLWELADQAAAYIRDGSRRCADAYNRRWERPMSTTDPRTQLAERAARWRENARSLERIAEDAEREANNPAPSMDAQRPDVVELVDTCRQRAGDWYAMAELAEACSRIPAHYPAVHLVTALDRFAAELEG